MDRANIEWCKNFFAMMADGAVWGIPRSGLLFRREGDTLVLVDSMPWMEGMPITAKELKQQQDTDYILTKAHFQAAGVKVERKP